MAVDCFILLIYSVSQKNPPCGFLTFFANGWEFLINFYTPIISSFLHQITNFYSIISNSDEVMAYLVQPPGEFFTFN